MTFEQFQGQNPSPRTPQPLFKASFVHIIIISMHVSLHTNKQSIENDLQRWAEKPLKMKV